MKSKRKIEKVLSIKRSISKYSKTVVIPPFMLLNHPAHSYTLSLSFSTYLFLYICVTATEITIQKKKKKKHGNVKCHGEREATKEINNSHSITSAIAWNKIRLLSIAIIVQCTMYGRTLFRWSLSHSLNILPAPKYLTHKQASFPPSLQHDGVVRIHITLQYHMIEFSNRVGCHLFIFYTKCTSTKLDENTCLSR